MKGFLFVYLIGVSSVAFSQIREDRSFSVDITEFAMFFDYKYYINTDSIYIVKKTFLPKETKMRYTHKWTEAEKFEIDKLAHKIKLDTLKTNYQAEGTDDNSEFVFYFAIGGSDKRITIYKCRIGPIADFVVAVNKGLPSEYRIGYNDQYFGR